MTQAWAIKGPDGDLHINTDCKTERDSWTAFVGCSLAWVDRQMEQLKAEGYTCVPVTIVEGSADTVMNARRRDEI